MAVKYLASIEDWSMFMYHKRLAEDSDVWSMTRSEHERAVRKWLSEHRFHELTCKGCRDEFYGDNCQTCIRYHRLTDCYEPKVVG